MQNLIIGVLRHFIHAYVKTEHKAIFLWHYYLYVILHVYDIAVTVFSSKFILKLQHKSDNTNQKLLLNM